MTALLIFWNTEVYKNIQFFKLFDLVIFDDFHHILDVVGDFPHFLNVYVIQT